MLILHASFHEHRLFLWGEQTTDAPRTTSAADVPEPANPRVETFPYDPGRERIKEVLERAGIRPSETPPPQKDPQDDEGQQTSGCKIAWLPGQGNVPIPSSPLIATPPSEDIPTHLSPWKVSAVPLHPADAIRLLGKCRQRRTLHTGVVIGDDLQFWSSALQFAGSLVARENFLPGLTQRNGGYLARWKPVFSGEDAEFLASLAEAMPPAARALSSQTNTPPTTPAKQVVRHFLVRAVDWLIRSSGKLRRREPEENFESIHDAWLHALRAESPEMSWDEEELRTLHEHIQNWRRPVSVTTTTPWRLCFRLEEPDPEGSNAESGEVIQTSSDDWHLRYLLQSHDDPSLRVPLAKLWEENDDVLSALRGDYAQVRKFTLASLGHAAEICSVVDTSLEAPRPSGCDLNSIQAYRFLSDDAPMLQQAGFGVFLPEWWTSRGTRTQITARATATSPELQGPGMLQLDSMVEYDWQLALGDYQLSLPELEQLADLKTPLIQVDGQWVEVNAEQIQTAIQFWRESQNTTGTVRELVEMSLGTTEPASEIEADQIRSEGELKELLDTLRSPDQFTEIDVPDNFQGTLRPYQVRGYSWLNFLRRWGLGGCLADDMGLGKTIQTLALIQHDWEAGCRQPVLVVCPTSVVSNWQREASRFTPDLPTLIHHGTDRDKYEDFRATAGSHAIIISSYGLLHRDVDFLAEIPWAGVVLDEAQNIKNPETKRARAARSLEADYRLALTGTPVQNHVGDLWSIMEFLNPGLLGPREDFRRRFLIPIQSGSAPRRADKLRRATQPFILRREKTDASIIQDLPEKMEMKVYCNLTREQASLYEAVLEDMNRGLEGAEGIRRDGIVFASLSKLKQICNHPAQFLGDGPPRPDRSGKLTRLTDMMAEVLELGERALIFTQFRVMGNMLKKHLQERFGQKVLFLHGGISQTRRTRMVDRFQSTDGRIPAFILSLKAGGTGLNLTAANHVFHFDRWWNPAVEDQATDRAFRIGQDRNVEVHKFICAGTVEERIDEMIDEKKEIADQIIGTGESWLSDLSNKRLREVFELGRDAIAD